MAALVRFASERSSSGDLEPRTKVTLSGNELCDKVTGDGLSDNFVKEHPVHEAPYRVYAAIRAAGRLATREGINKKEQHQLFFVEQIAPFPT